MTCRDPDILRLREQAVALRAQAASLRVSAGYSDDRTAWRREMAEADQRDALAAAAAARADAAEAAYRRDVQLISVGAHQVGLDEATLRALIGRHTAGRTGSRAETTAAERRAILGDLKASGFRPERAGRRRGRPAADQMDRQTMLTRVEQLLAEQALPWGYAEAILRRQRGILDTVIACPIAGATDPELRGVIAALHRRGKRHGAGGVGGVS